MASEKLRAVFDAVDNISQTLEKIDTSFEDLGSSVEGLSNDFEDNALSSQGLQQAQERLSSTADEADRSFDGLSRALNEYGISSQAANAATEQVGSSIDDLESEVDSAKRSFESLAVVQGMTTVQAATNAGAMKIAGNMIDEMGDDALKSAGQMGVLNTVMEELSLSGSALSVNIGAFNVSLRNLAPLVPIAASMGSVVTAMGALITSLGAATVAFAGFTAGGAIGFLEDIESEVEGVNNQAEALQALMGGIGDLFKAALEPLQSAENTQFFINLVEGAADLVNRLAQAIDQMRDAFMPLFTGFADIINSEFDSIANAIEDMIETMTPVLLGLFGWFMEKLPDALRFMARVTQDLAGPVGNLGNSILDLLSSIVETAVAIFQGLAPALSVALDVATAVVDVFNALSNGALQAALFIGSLVFAANKFVGIADTIANVGISAANTMSQWAGSIRSAGGVIPRMNDALANQFEHLRALGSVLTGNMSVQQASGQVQKDFKEEVQDFAEALLEAEDGSEKLRNKLIELQLAMKDGGVEGGQEKLEEFQDELDETGDKVDEKMDNVAESAAEGMDGVDDATSDAAESVSENMDDISDSTESMDGAPQVDVGMDTVQDKLEGSSEQIDDVADSADELGEKLGPEVADAMSSSSDEIADATDNIVEGVGSISKRGDEIDIRDAKGQFTSLGAETDDLARSLQGIDLDNVDVSDVDVDNITDLRTELIRSSDNADELLDGVDNVTDALSEGALGAGPMEPIITDDSLEAINGMSGSFDEAGDSAMGMGNALDDVSGEAVGIAIPERLDTADQKAAEAASRMEDSFQSMDLAEGFETMDITEKMDFDETADLVEADLDESLGRIETEEFFDMADAPMPDFSDAADDMSTFNKEFETAMDFDVPFDDVQLEEPFERADAAVQSFDDDMLAMADSADELDLSETMDPIETDNLDAVKGKLGDVRDRAQAFGKRTSDAMRSAGQGISDFATGAGDEIGGAAGSIREGLDTIGGAAKEQAALMKRSFMQAGGATGIMSSAVDKAKLKLGALKTSAIQAAGSLKVMAFSAWESIKALAVQGGQAAKTALRNWYLAFSQGGVVAGFKAMASSAYGAVAGLVAAAAGAITTAASFVAGLIPATLSAGLALNTAFAGIPALLGALIALSAIAVGVLGNMDGVTSGLKGAFDGLKSAISQIGDALLSVGVPAWNLFIDIIEMALAPFLAIYDGIMLVAEALGIAGGEGGGLGSIIGGLLDKFSAIMNIIGAMFDFVAPAFSFIGDLIYKAIIIPFQIVAGVISTTIQILRGLVALAIEKIPFLSEIVGGLQSAFEMVKNAIAQIPAFMDTVASMIGGTIDAIVGGIQDALQPAVDFINGLIEQANKLPEVNIDTVEFGDLGGGGGASEALSGAQTSADEVRDNVRRGEEEPGDDVATEPDVDLSLEDSVENNVQVDADPEDQAQLSRITKDALEEANSFARRQQGGQ
jgi:phage-related protein